MNKGRKIPIIDAKSNGYWAVYPDQKVWHSETMKFKEYEEAKEEYDIGGGDWMRLQKGDNWVRIVSEFHPFGTHWSKSENRSYVCIGEDKGCEFCQQEDKPRVRFLGWVIDRKDGKLKLLRIGYSIFKQIGRYAQIKDYEFDVTPPYDFDIKRHGTGLDTTYQVIPARKDKPLTKEEQALVKDKQNPKEIIEKMKENLKEGDEGEDEIDVDEDIPF